MKYPQILSFSIFLVSSWACGASSPVDPNIFINLSKKAMPSVVNISTLSTVKGPYLRGGEDPFRKLFEDFFRQHGGLPQGGGNRGRGDEEEEDPYGGQGGMPPKAMSLGTGFIIDSSGLILTNNHVVQEADEIKINFTEDDDEQPSDAEVVGRDPEIDVALIRVKTKRPLQAISLGDSDQVEVGEYVMAVGNPFGHGHSVTHGIISAKGRKAPDFPLASYLQTDASINPGNSGGPLINLKGEVIGINNAIDQRAQGIGFAIPISTVKQILPQLKTKGMVARGYVGVLVNELTPEVASQIGAPQDLKAPFVTHVYPGEPADKAGLKPYDVILIFNGKKILRAQDLISGVTAVPVGESVEMKVLRGGQEKILSIKVAERPGAQQLAKKDPSKPKKERAPKVETGMSLEELTPEIARDLGMSEKSKAVVVSNVNFEGPADKAGLMRGDIILEVDRKAVQNLDQFYATVKSKRSYLLRVRRTDPQGHEVFMVIVLDLKT